MIHVDNYISELTAKLKENFGSRLCYVGLQGSYLRGEASDSSDIDIMVIIDGLDVPDLDAYRRIIEAMPHFDKSCGFICSRRDMKNWNPMEVCHVLHTTRDYFGVLGDLVPAYTEQDVRNFVKMSVNNLYHEICHRYIHADDETNSTFLPGTYKAVFFILQNLHYLRHGVFIGTKAEVLAVLDGADRAVLERSMAMNRGDSFDFSDSFRLLFNWCRDTMENL